MVLAYHGKSLRLAEVQQFLGAGRNGADALSVVNAARHHGLRARGVKVADVDYYSSSLLPRSRMWSAVRSALATIVSVVDAPPEVGMKEPSAT